MGPTMNISDVCIEIFAGGDAPKGKMSDTRSEKHPYPIYSNGEQNEGLYGFASFPRVVTPSITVSARGTIGYTAVRTEPFVPIVRLITLIPNLDLVDLRYLFYAVQNYSFSGSGTSIPQLTVPMLKKYSFPVPEKEEQCHIVNLLDQVARILTLRKRQLSKLDELVKSRFVEMIQENKPSYVKLKDVVEKDRIITYGIVKPGEYTEGGIPIIKVKDFPNDVILMHDMLLASPEIESKYERSRVREGDLLFSIRGSVGRTAFVPKELTDANITQDTARLSISDNFSPKYVRAALEYDPVQYDISQYVRGVAVRGINLADLREIEIPVVDLALQEQFAAFVEQTDKSKLSVQQSIDQLETLKKSLMQKYFG